MTHAEIHHARMAFVDEMAQAWPHDQTNARSFRARYEELQLKCAFAGHLFGRTFGGGDTWCVICTASRLKGIDFREPESPPG